MARQLLFPQLTREHAIQLDNMVNDYTSTEQREQQISALHTFLCADGLPYSSRAALQILEDLAPFTSYYSAHNALGECYDGREPLPKCVLETYRAMFLALDVCLAYIIENHWEVETVTDPETLQIEYSSTFYSREEAEKEYHAERLAGKYVRLIQVYEPTNVCDVLEVSWMV